MKVAIVNYSSGNIGSVANALHRLGVDASLTDSAAELKSADRVIFPGVGEASSAMRNLRERGLDDAIRSLTRPVLAICLGMQLLFSHSEEGDTECLGVLPGQVRRFDSAGQKVPHMGWNSISHPRSQLFHGIDDGERFYFVHSFFVDRSSATVAECDYGSRFTAAVAHNNFYGVQFHPEKSSKAGSTVLRNFLRIEKC